MAEGQVAMGFEGIKGKLGTWSMRRVGGKSIICRLPKPPKTISPAQVSVREMFHMANEYAKWVFDQPAVLAEYRSLSQARGIPARAMMVSDYCVAPEVTEIKLDDFHGKVGDPITVKAVDDVGVTAVKVAIRAEDESLLEEGPATSLRGEWVYTATQAYPPGTPVSITATAVDRPGHKGSKMVTWS